MVAGIVGHPLRRIAASIAMQWKVAEAGFKRVPDDFDRVHQLSGGK